MICCFPGCEEVAIMVTQVMCDWYSVGVEGMGWEIREPFGCVCSKHKCKTTEEIRTALQEIRYEGI